MSIKDIKTPDIKIKYKGEEWNVKFTLRHFAALQERFGISENDILQGLIKGEIKKLPFAIWTATLVFAPFDPLEPTKIEKELQIEELFNLDLMQLKELSDNVIQAMEAFLPKAPGGAEKKQEKTKSSK